MHFPGTRTTCQGGPWKFADKEAETENACTRFVQTNTKCVRRISCNPEDGPTWTYSHNGRWGRWKTRACNPFYNSVVQPPSPDITLVAVYIFIKDVRSLSRYPRHPLTNQLPNSFHFQKTKRRSAAISQHWISAGENELYLTDYSGASIILEICLNHEFHIPNWSPSPSYTETGILDHTSYAWLLSTCLLTRCVSADLARGT